MADRIVREVDDPVVASGSEVHEVTTATPTIGVIIARIIWWVAGVIITLLAIRFILALLGANPGNAFANFIYSVSHPFVAPFFSLFRYDLRTGVSHFELYTLVAMVVYALIAWGLARLATLGSSGSTYHHHATRV